MQYFGEPEGWVKIQMMSKTLQRYYTLIRDLFSNVFVSQKFWLAKVFDLSRGPKWDEYKYRVIFVLVSRVIHVLYEAVLGNKWLFSVAEIPVKH